MSPPPNHQPPSATTDPADPRVLRLEGRWTLRFANEVGDALRDLPDGVEWVDARGVQRLDTFGVLQLLRFADRRELDFERFLSACHGQIDFGEQFCVEQRSVQRSVGIVDLEPFAQRVQ